MSATLTLRQFFNDHYRPRRLRGCSPHTLRLYGHSIRQFERTLGREALLSDFNSDALARHLMRLADEGLSVASRNKELAQLVAIWRQACRQGLVKEWPDVLPEREPQREPIAWTVEQLARLLQHIDTLRGDIGGVPASLWWRNLVCACLETGERVSAVFTARWDWLQGDWLLIPAEARKGKTRDRRYQLSPQLVASLGRQRLAVGTRQRQIFPWPYASATYLQTRFGAILEGAGLPSHRAKFHQLRRTVASVLHAAGADASAALDHSRSSVTRDYYIDRRFTNEVPVGQIVSGWLNGEPAPRPQPSFPEADPPAAPPAAAPMPADAAPPRRPEDFLPSELGGAVEFYQRLKALNRPATAREVHSSRKAPRWAQIGRELGLIVPADAVAIEGGNGARCWANRYTPAAPEVAAEILRRIAERPHRGGQRGHAHDVADRLRELGRPATAAEISNGSEALRKRIRESVRRGLIVELGRRRVNPSGKPPMLYGLPGDGPASSSLRVSK